MTIFKNKEKLLKLSSNTLSFMKMPGSHKITGLTWKTNNFPKKIWRKLIFYKPRFLKWSSCSKMEIRYNNIRIQETKLGSPFKTFTASFHCTSSTPMHEGNSWPNLKS